MNLKTHLVVVIPAFNNGRTLLKVIESIPIIPDTKISVVVVDDRSPDNTYSVARGKTHHVIRHRTNRGVGAATKTAFKYILSHRKLRHANYVIKLDGDGQHNAWRIPQLLEKLKAGAHLVIFSRFHKDSVPICTPTNRIVLNEAYAEILSTITGWEISDARSGFMGMQLKILKPILDTLCVDRYGIPMNIILGLWKHNPQARVVSLAHPAIYGGETLTAEHCKRYTEDGESFEEIRNRFNETWDAFEKISTTCGIPSENYHYRADDALYYVEQTMTHHLVGT